MDTLLIYRDPATWASLSAGERAAVAREHDAFQRSVPEMIFTEAFTDPAQSTTVRVRRDGATVADGTCLGTEAFLCGCHLVDCARRERAVELAARVPDARYAAVEVRELTHQLGIQYEAEA